MPEGRLSFDERTRRLNYAIGSRADTKTEGALKTVLAVLAEDTKAGGDGLSVRAIVTGVDGDHPQHATRAAIKVAVTRQMITAKRGARGAKLHSILTPATGAGCRCRRRQACICQPPRTLTQHGTAANERPVCGVSQRFSSVSTHSDRASASVCQCVV